MADVTLKDLAPVIDIIAGAYIKLNADPTEKAYRHVTRKELEAFADRQDSIIDDMRMNGITVANRIDFLRLQEVQLDWFTRALTFSKLAELYEPNLTKEQLQMVRDLGLTKLADLFEDCIAYEALRAPDPLNATRVRRVSLESAPL